MQSAAYKYTYLQKTVDIAAGIFISKDKPILVVPKP